MKRLLFLVCLSFATIGLGLDHDRGRTEEGTSYPDGWRDRAHLAVKAHWTTLCESGAFNQEFKALSDPARLVLLKAVRKENVADPILFELWHASDPYSRQLHVGASSLSKEIRRLRLPADALTFPPEKFRLYVDSLSDKSARLLFQWMELVEAPAKTQCEDLKRFAGVPDPAKTEPIRLENRKFLRERFSTEVSKSLKTWSALETPYLIDEISKLTLEDQKILAGLSSGHVAKVAKRFVELREKFPAEAVLALMLLEQNEFLPSIIAKKEGKPLLELAVALAELEPRAKDHSPLVGRSFDTVVEAAWKTRLSPDDKIKLAILILSKNKTLDDNITLEGLSRPGIHEALTEIGLPKLSDPKRKEAIEFGDKVYLPVIEGRVPTMRTRDFHDEREKFARIRRAREFLEGEVSFTKEGPELVSDRTRTLSLQGARNLAQDLSDVADDWRIKEAILDPKRKAPYLVGKIVFHPIGGFEHTPSMKVQRLDQYRDKLTKARARFHAAITNWDAFLRLKSGGSPLRIGERAFDGIIQGPATQAYNDATGKNRKTNLQAALDKHSEEAVAALREAVREGELPANVEAMNKMVQALLREEGLLPAQVLQSSAIVATTLVTAPFVAAKAPQLLKLALAGARFTTAVEGTRQIIGLSRENQKELDFDKISDMAALGFLAGPLTKVPYVDKLLLGLGTVGGAYQVKHDLDNGRPYTAAFDALLSAWSASRLFPGKANPAAPPVAQPPRLRLFSGSGPGPEPAAPPAPFRAYSGTGRGPIAPMPLRQQPFSYGSSALAAPRSQPVAPAAAKPQLKLVTAPEPQPHAGPVPNQLAIGFPGFLTPPKPALPIVIAPIPDRETWEEWHSKLTNEGYSKEDIRKIIGDGIFVRPLVSSGGSGPAKDLAAETTNKKPREEKVRQAMEAMKKGPISDEDAETLLAWAVYGARASLADCAINLYGAKSLREALSAKFLEGGCAGGQSATGYILEAWGIDAKNIVGHQLGKLGLPSSHGFNVVNMPNGKTYLVDVTFGQFLLNGDQKNLSVNERRTLQKLLTQGFVELDAASVEGFRRFISSASKKDPKLPMLDLSKWKTPTEKWTNEFDREDYAEWFPPKPAALSSPEAARKYFEDFFLKEGEKPEKKDGPFKIYSFRDDENELARGWRERFGNTPNRWNHIDSVGRWMQDNAGAAWTPKDQLRMMREVVTRSRVIIDMSETAGDTVLEDFGDHRLKEDPQFPHPHGSVYGQERALLKAAGYTRHYVTLEHQGGKGLLVVWIPPANVNQDALKALDEKIKKAK